MKIKTNLVSLIILSMLSMMLVTTVVDAKDINKLPKGFQKLSDVTLLNGTDLIPEDVRNTVIIPEGFYGPLEKNSNATKILESEKKLYKKDKIFKNPKIPLDIPDKNRKIFAYSRNNISSNINNVINNVDTCSDIGNDLNMTFENVTQLWNSTEDGYVSVDITKDIDGDNLNDTIITARKYDSCKGLYYTTIEVRKGKDGSILWKETFSGKSFWLYWDLIDDVDGDHLSDMLITNYEYDSLSNQYFSQIIIKNGKSGTEIWKESAVGAFVNGYAAGDLNGDTLNDILIQIYYYNLNMGILKAKKGIDNAIIWQESDNGLTEGSSVKDINGDGLNDILVNVFKSSSDVLSAKKGIDGSTLWQENLATSGDINGESAGDLTGDKLNDILVHIYDYSSGMDTIKARNGLNGNVLWQESMPNVNMFILYTGDMSGDGLNDILIKIYDLSWNHPILKARNGLNGNVLWQESLTNGHVDPEYIGDINGDGFDDILVKIDDPGTKTQILKAKKGKDGSTLWQESITNGYIYDFSAGDINGDKLNDFLVKIDDYNSNTGIFKAKKGIDGSILWQQSDAFGIPIGDLNGDKLNDVLIYTYPPNSNIISAKKGIDGTILWQESNISGGSSAGDLNGDELNDLFVNKYGINTESLIAKKGIDGSNLWSATPNVYDEEESTYDYNLGDLNGDKTNDALFYTGNKIYAVTTSIKSPSTNSIKVVSPNGGEIWQSGSTQTVKWSYTGNPGTNVKVDLLKSGSVVKTLVSSVSIGSGGNGTYSWKMDTSRTPGTDYKIRITSTSNSAYTDMSDNNFTITGPILVTVPNGGENWRHGTTHTIQWSKTGSTGSNVKIELLKSGTLVKTISSSTANDGSYSWAIPSTQTPANDYKIRITSTSNSAYKDTSDNNFIIST